MKVLYKVLYKWHRIFSTLLLANEHLYLIGELKTLDKWPQIGLEICNSEKAKVMPRLTIRPKASVYFVNGPTIF